MPCRRARAARRSDARRGARSRRSSPHPRRSSHVSAPPPMSPEIHRPRRPPGSSRPPMPTNADARTSPPSRSTCSLESSTSATRPDRAGSRCGDGQAHTDAAATGRRIVAVEPVEAMREVLGVHRRPACDPRCGRRSDPARPTWRSRRRGRGPGLPLVRRTPVARGARARASASMDPSRSSGTCEMRTSRGCRASRT